MSELNVHLGTCGRCGGNVTRYGKGIPRCEQCHGEPVLGPVLPMKPAAESAPPLTRDPETGRFQRGK